MAETGQRKRKTPVRHKVRHHIRKNRPVRKHMRGKGAKRIILRRTVPTQLRSKAFAGETIKFERRGGRVIATIDGKHVGVGKDRDAAFLDAKKTLRKEYDQAHGITPTVRRYKSKALPLKDLEAMEERKWTEINAMEKRAMREGWSDEKRFQKRLEIVRKHEFRKPDVKPIIYKTAIGHYGGLHVDVPEEYFAQFKAHFPPREFPRSVRTIDVREKYTFEGERNFRKRFPNSNRIKEVYFADRSRGLRRLDFLDMPRPE